MEQPKSALDHYEHGRVLKHARMYDQAREEFQRAATDPQHAGNAQVQIALCLLATGRYEDAGVAYRQALEVGTFSRKENAHLYLLGKTLEALGRVAHALEAHGWARNEIPTFQDVEQRMRHLLARGRGLLPRRRPASRDWKRDTRRHVRVAVRLQSHFSSKERRVIGDGELRDLSLGGCRVRSLVAVPVGVELECCIFSQDARDPFTIEGAMVRWSRPLEFGLAFTKVHPSAQQQITQLCSVLA
jgi:tetratricopeptide (TPR) repeat protein